MNVTKEYASNLSDEQWRLIEKLIQRRKSGAASRSTGEKS
ncbi:hypothetical protein Pan14r_51070 [Crateriforma conspicua]|uniref:Uncharacterized protein n=1 Tax=Crateriforma conspicua TaxID=2527996 RepID=A0A5C5XRT4_9PLAN|nr:hypothetical protein Pan14r_51070 [Crateriforma conspicua]